MKRLANVLTAVVLLVAVVIGVQKYRTTTTSAETTTSSMNFNEVLSLDFTAAPRTLVIAVRQDCHFCSANMAFYRRLIETRDQQKTRLRIAVAAPPKDTGAEAYLSANGVHPDAFAYFPPGHIPIDVAPTLIVADRRGNVIRMWPGFLSEQQQEIVLRDLFSTN